MNFTTLPPARRYPRAMLHGSAQINLGAGHTCAGEVLTLSQGGTFVSGIAPLRIGEVVELWLLLPKVAMPIRGHARVLYNTPAHGRRCQGTGFEFVAMSEDHLARVVRTVERLQYAV